MTSQEAESRKQKIMEQLKAENVPYLELLQQYYEGKFRSKEEICIRAICLMIVAVRAEGLEKEEVWEYIEAYSIVDDFSPKELIFLNKEGFDYQDKVNFIWRYESLWILLWILGYVQELSRPEDICDVAFAVGVIHDRGKERFIKEANRISFSDVLDQAELTFRYHWAVRNQIVKGLAPLPKLDHNIIYERRYALEWVINNYNKKWDEVSIST